VNAKFADFSPLAVRAGFSWWGPGNQLRLITPGSDLAGVWPGDQLKLIIPGPDLAGGTPGTSVS